MHHIITVKAWASDADEAQSEVDCMIQDSIDQSNNTCGWDYASENIVLITEDQLKAEGFKSFADLEKFKIQERLDTMSHLQAEIRTDLQVLIAPFFLNKVEAVLYVGEEDTEFAAYIEKFLKRKKDIRKPDSFEKILDIFTNVVTSIAKKDCGRSLLMYRMEQIKKLQYCIENPTQTCYTLQSTENNFAELPCHDTKGLTPFYFLCDRHY